MANNIENEGFYVIARIHRDDVLSLFQGDKKMKKFIEKELNMERLANKMADDYLNQLFWSSAEIITRYLYEERK